ncbi:hypothetical protein PIB30_037799, partial [Stylosanthes scabra]|nr:hypothetical protein [Stylosanthes scabra]
VEIGFTPTGQTTQSMNALGSHQLIVPGMLLIRLASVEATKPRGTHHDKGLDDTDVLGLKITFPVQLHN